MPTGSTESGARLTIVKRLAFAEARGMRPLVAHSHLGLGRLYARTGEVRQATEHLDMAATIYRDLDMPYWLEQVEREIRSGRS